MIFIGMYGPSESGKTELAEKIIRYLSSRGFKVGYVKHTPEGFDLPGKDTDRAFNAGAKFSAGVGNEEFFIRIRGDYSLGDIERFLPDVDIVLVEGFRDADIPKIKVGNCPTEKMTVYEYSENFDDIVAWIERLAERKRNMVVKLKVNGKNIPLNSFVQNIFKEVILGMARSLKGVDNPKEIDITIKLS